MDPRESVTDLLVLAAAGDRAALDRAFPLVYDELRRLAHHQLRRENEGHTLSTTALVHEAYMRLVDQKAGAWQDRRHFFAIAATAMRRTQRSRFGEGSASAHGAVRRRPSSIRRKRPCIADGRMR